MILISARDELTTYRYLRIALPILVVLLGAAVVNQIFALSQIVGWALSAPITTRRLGPCSWRACAAWGPA